MKNEIVYLRVFATLLVVLGHSWLYNGFSGFELSDIPGAMTGSFLYSINHFIYTFHMPIFFALSGFLLELSNKRRGNIKAWEFLKKKSFRLLLPFFIITLFYCLPVKAFVGLFEGLSFTNIVYSQFVQANNAHTWFLLALFWCMLMGLIVSFVDLNKNKKYLFLLILLIICIHIIGIPNRMKAFDVFCLAKGLRYSIFFVGGYFISKYMRITPHHHISHIKFFCLFLCVFIFSEILLYWYPRQKSGFLEAKLLLILQDIVGLSSFIVFYIIAIFVSNKFNYIKPIIYLDKHSYEVYLYSEPLNYLILFACANYGSWPFESYYLYWGRFFITLIVSLAIAKLINFNYGQK